MFFAAKGGVSVRRQAANTINNKKHSYSANCSWAATVSRPSCGSRWLAAFENPETVAAVPNLALPVGCDQEIPILI